MIRSYLDQDYEQIKQLYQRKEWYGGVFDEARDSRDKLQSITQNDPEAILIYELDGQVFATISIIEDGRVAMLYRFVVPTGNAVVEDELYQAAINILKSRGHKQILVYSDNDSKELDSRYLRLGMTKGGSYVCFWVDI